MRASVSLCFLNAIQGACDVLRAVDMTASPLYTKALRPHTTEKMQDLTAVLCKRPGITLMDNELMGCQGMACSAN